MREDSPHQTCPQTKVDPVSPHRNEADTDPSRWMTLRRRLIKADVFFQQTKAPHHHTNIRQRQTRADHSPRQTAENTDFPHIKVSPTFQTEMDSISKIENKPHSPCYQLQVSSPVDVDSLPTPPPTDWSVKEFSLSVQDKLALSSGEWMNDLHISAAQQLFRTDFPNIQGLQSSLLGVHLKFQSINTNCVQILNFSGHWACVSTIGCNPGHVDIYDSLFSTPPSSLVQQLCSLLQPKDSHLVVNMTNMQSQSGGSDCGFFAIASATALCHGQNPSSLKWIQIMMRQHLLNCLTDCTFTPFPLEKRACKASHVKKTFTFSVFCSCRMPADRKGMLRCIQCLEWYHRKCLNIPWSAFKKGVFWTCPSCMH